jgi:hypothetical protein
VEGAAPDLAAPHAAKPAAANHPVCERLKAHAEGFPPGLPSRTRTTHLRFESPQWFDADGKPLSPRMLLFPTTRLTRVNRRGEHPYDESTAGYWLEVWLQQFQLVNEHGNNFDPARVFMYAFRHTYAQIRADAGVPLDVLQALMSHQEPSTTQTYYRVSHPRRVEAVRVIAAKYRFDLSGGRVRPLSPGADLVERVRAGVGSVPVPAGQCHEMNNVRADGRGCPVYYRCFSCKFLTTSIPSEDVGYLDCAL